MTIYGWGAVQPPPNGNGLKLLKIDENAYPIEDLSGCIQLLLHERAPVLSLSLWGLSCSSPPLPLWNDGLADSFLE